MLDFLYTVWFRDEFAELDDQDREWSACFVIKALSQPEAKSWGDYLATCYCTTHINAVFLHSDVALASKSDIVYSPAIECGSEAEDWEVGW